MFPDVEPIFIVGCVRSGTSAVVGALKNAGHIRGYNEGGAIPLLHRLLKETERFFQSFSDEYLSNEKHYIANLDRRAIETDLINVFTGQLIEMMGRGRWLDKTPEGPAMIRACPTLLKAFPKAKFIFCKRRAIENILSRQRKFGTEPFEVYCLNWAATMSAWLEVRNQLRGASIELDQRDMAVQPERAACAIRKLLDLRGEVGRDIERILSSNRFQQTRAVQDAIYIGLDETGWSKNNRQIFLDVCMPMMQEYGYSAKADDGPVTTPIQLFVPVPAAANVIRKCHVIDEPWGFKKVSEETMQLHPNEGGKPAAEIRYLAVKLSGHQAFRASLSLGHGRAHPVEFGFRIENANGETCVSESRKVASDSPVEWETNFDPLDGVYDIVITTRMADESDSNSMARAWWTRPRFE